MMIFNINQKIKDMKNLLLNREYEINGNWYAPEKFLNSFNSVIDTELINTSSSAGDWDGLIFQKIKNTVFVIPFSQENNYTHSGYKVYTSDKYFCKVKNFNHDIKNVIIQEYCNILY